jgi:tRNA pseudouridine55 synthase
MEGDRAAFEIECSSGTYIRQLVSDLGDAYCEQLERTAIGSFSLDEADPDRVVGVGEALAFLPERILTEPEARQVAHGVSVSAVAASTADAVRLTFGGELIAVAEPRGSQLAPVVVFAG